MLLTEYRFAVERPNWELGSELIKLQGLPGKVLFIPSVSHVAFLIMSLPETKAVKYVGILKDASLHFALNR